MFIDAWACLVKLYANPCSSRTMGLAKLIILPSYHSQHCWWNRYAWRTDSKSTPHRSHDKWHCSWIQRTCNCCYWLTMVDYLEGVLFIIDTYYKSSHHHKKSSIIWLLDPGVACDLDNLSLRQLCKYLDDIIIGDGVWIYVHMLERVLSQSHFIPLSLSCFVFSIYETRPNQDGTTVRMKRVCMGVKASPGN